MGDLILVVDIGGGTTDFTLIAVTEQGGELVLDRVAVGEHILLGGDNIDLALAGVVAQRLAEKGTRIDSRQLPGAVGRTAAWPRRSCSIPGRRSRRSSRSRFWARARDWWAAPSRRRCSARMWSASWAKDSCRRWRSQDMPARQRRVGLAGTRAAVCGGCGDDAAHGAVSAAAGGDAWSMARCGAGRAAWRARRTSCSTAACCNAGLVRERILATLDSWLAAEGLPPVKPLSGEDLMHAVSRGAAYYGLARHGTGVRIRGGVPRTYYVGIESAMPSVPGFPAPLKALAVVPFGMEEGTETRIPGREFGLVVGEPAEFRFFTSSSREERSAGRPDRGLSATSWRSFRRWKWRSRPARMRRKWCRCSFETRGDRDGHAAVVVRGARRAAVEAGVQRPREGGGLVECNGGTQLHRAKSRIV